MLSSRFIRASRQLIIMQLSLAKPVCKAFTYSIRIPDCCLSHQLCYTRGSVIPCALSINCQDAQGLDLLSMPRAIDVRLERQVAMGGEASNSSTSRIASYCLPYETTSLDIQAATWWPTNNATNQRFLMGEIHLARDLKPSCQVGQF